MSRRTFLPDHDATPQAHASPDWRLRFEPGCDPACLDHALIDSAMNRLFARG